MKQESLKTKAQNLVIEMQIKTFFQMNKNKNMTYGYSKMLYEKGLNEVIEDITLSKTLLAFNQKINAKVEAYTKKSIFPSIINGFIFGIFNGDLNIYFSEIQNKMLLIHNFNLSSTKRLIEEYKNTILEYIQNDEALLNSIITGGNTFDISFFNTLLSQLFVDRSYFNTIENENVRVIAKIILELQSLYTAETLFNNKEFVTYEIKNGFFREYTSELNKNNNVPSLQSRIDAYELQKETSQEEKSELENLSLLEERINSLGLKYKQNVFTLLKQVKTESDRRKRLDLIDDCFSLYEIAYREEIIDNLFTPEHSIEVKKFANLKNILVQVNTKERNLYPDNVNQISVSLYSPETILNLDTCIGIGFDSKGLKPENIAVSSATESLSNIGITESNTFKLLSSPLSELKKSTKSELVLFRKNINSETKSSYVFVVITGYNYQKDQEALVEAQRISRDTYLNLVVFNLPEIKKSITQNNPQ